jgi:hypothetical protein
MTSQIAREQISRKIDILRWKKCPSRIPDAPKIHVEASILANFETVDKATALDDLATAVFTEMPERFEDQPLGTQREILLRSQWKPAGLTAYLIFFEGNFWLS